MQKQRIGTGTPGRSEAGRSSSTHRVGGGRRAAVALLAVLGLALSTLGFFPVASDAHTVALTGANDTYNGTWPPNGTPGWNLPAANPPIAESCGIDVGILVDRSGSIADAGEQTTMRNAAKSIVDSLAGTPSRVGVWSFGDGSSAAGDATHPAQALTGVGGAGGPAGVTSLKATIDSIPIVSGVATNWEAGFGAVHDAAVSAGDAADLLFVLTDGKPTVHIGDSSTGGTTNNDDLDGGIRTANLVKGDDTRVFTVGIGDLDATTLGLVSNNEAWSGSNILTAGYAITDFDSLQSTLHDLVTALCGGTVTVLKRVDGAPANGWDFTLQGPGGPYTGTTGDDGAGLVDFDVADLPWPGGSSVTLTETPEDGYALDGVTCANSNGPDPVITPVTNGVSFTLTPLAIIECIVDNVPRPPGISVTKTANPAGPVSAGGTIGFDITVESTGQSTANGVVLTDTLPGGFSWSENPDNPDCSIASGILTCDYGALPPSATRTVHIQSGTDGNDCGTVRNSAQVVTSNDGSDDSSASVEVRCPDVQLTKTADAASVSAGSPIGFTITATNYGSGTATNVTINDPLPAGPGIAWSESPDNPDCSIAAGTLTCSKASLASGASLSVHVTSPTTAGSCGSYDNSATVSTSNDGSDGASDSVDVLCPDVELVKEADAGSVAAGSPIGFTITATNYGPGTATNVTINDPLPAGPGIAWSESPDNPDCSIAAGTLTCSVASLASGASLSVHVTSPTTLDSCGSYDNTATVIVSNGAGDEDSADTDVLCAELQVVKTAVSTGDACPGVDGSPLVVDEGDPVTYCYVVTNTGDGTAFGVVLVDDNGTPGSPGDDFAVPLSGLTAGNLLPGQTATGSASGFSFAPGVVVNTATASATTGGGLPLSDDDDATVEITDVEPTIEVTKDADPTTVPEPGGDVEFTVSVENTSDESVWITSITDSVEGGPSFDVTALADTTCATGVEIAAGDTYTCEFTVSVSGNAGDVVDDEVVVTVVDDDESEADDADDAAVEITDVEPTIEVTKDADPTTVPEPGGDVEFTVSVENTSDESVWITSITDSVEGGPSFDVTALADTTCATGVEIAAGDTYTCEFTVSVSGNAGDVVDDEVVVTVVDDDESEADDADDAAVEVTDVPPTVDVTKDDGGASVPAPGGNVPFTVTITNTSDEDVTVVSITDSIEGGAAFDVTVAGGPVVSTTCSTGVVLEPDESYECSFTVEVTGLGGEVIADTVVATVVDDDGTQAVDDDDEQTPVTPVADLAIDKEFTGTALSPGGQGAFDLVVTNLGPSAATDVVVTDVLPDGLTFVSASGPGWACGASGQAITCTRPSLASGESSTIHVVVTVDADIVGNSVENVASVRGDEPDPDPENNQDEDLAPVVRVLPAAAQPLPVTGSDLGRLAGMALGILGAGAALLAVSRRRLTGAVR